MIAQAAHEEEGSREFGGVLGPYHEGSGPNIVPPLPLGACGPLPATDRDEAAGTSESECSSRPPNAFREELRLGILSTRAGLFNRGAFPAW